MAQITINEALVLTKAVRERLNDLKRLRSEVSKTESYMYSNNERKTIEPQYDVKAVDKKIVGLETFLLRAETAIKKSNAVTNLTLDFYEGELLEPIQ